jgi:hypothetical protein
MIGVLLLRSFTKKPNGSNSTETELSVVNLRTDNKFLITEGETSTFARWKGRGVRVAELEAVIGKKDPLPTTMLFELSFEGE